MTSPSVRAWAAATNTTDSLPDFAVSLPTRVAGDLLLGFVAGDFTQSITQTGAWVELADTTGATVSLGVYARIATNDTNDDLAVRGANNQDSSVNVCSIQDHGVADVATDIVLGTGASGSSAAADPPNADGGTAQDWLSLAVAVVELSAAGSAITALPATYTGGVIQKSASSTSSVALGVGERALSGAQTEDPGTFTNTSGQWLTATVLVPPVPLPPTQSFDVPTATLTLSGVAPTISGSGDAGLTVPTATLALIGLAPAVQTTTPWQTFDDGVASSTGATVTGLTNGTDYEFRVAAVNDFGQSDWSNIAGPYTPASGPQSFSIPTATLSLTAFAPTLAGTGIATLTVPPSTLTLSGLPPQISAGVGNFPVSVSVDGRTILDQHGNPWPCLGDSNIVIHVIPHLTVDEVVTGTSVESYLDQLVAHGLNSFWCKFVFGASGGLLYEDVDGNAPFTGTIFQSALNDPYWDNWETIFQMAAVRGITLFIFPTWAGIDDIEGDRPAMEAASATQMEDYGEAIGARFASYQNLIWMSGGDRATPSATLVTRWGNVATGVQNGGATQLWGLHTRREIFISDYRSTFGMEAHPLDLNTMYQDDTNPTGVTQTAWTEDIGPLIAYEMHYENEHGITFDLLRLQYWGPFAAGAVGHVYGNRPRWHMNIPGAEAYFVPGVSYLETWDDPDGNDDRGTDDFAVFADFLTSLNGSYAEMAPDTTDTFLTAGEGTGRTRSAARFDANGTSGVLAVAYRPHNGSATLTFDLTEFTAVDLVVVSKFDPFNGTKTAIGTYPTTGSQNVGSLGNNGSGSSDWAILFEAALTVEVPTASLTLTANPVTVSGSGATTFAIPTATLPLVAVAPAVAGSGAATLQVPVASTALEAIAPAVTATGAAPLEIPTAMVALSGVAPALSGSGDVPFTIPSAALTIGAIPLGISATGIAPIEIPTAQLVLTALAPSLIGAGAAPITVPPATLTLSGRIPIIIAEGGVQNFFVPTATLQLTGVTPTLIGVGEGSFGIPTATLSLAGVPPTILGSGVAQLTIPPATLSLLGINVGVTAGAAPQQFTIPIGLLNLSALSPIVEGSGEASLMIPPAALSLAGVAPTILGSGAMELIVPTATLLLAGIPIQVATGTPPTEFLIPTAVLALGGVPPVLAGSGIADLVIPTAQLVLQPNILQIQGVGETSLVVPSALLTLVASNIFLFTGQPLGPVLIFGVERLTGEVGGGRLSSEVIEGRTTEEQ